MTRHTLTVESAYGGAWPGTLTNGWGTALSCSVTNSPVRNGTTQYVCTGWAGAGCVTNGSGTNIAFVLAADSTLTWLWKTQYLATASAGAHGAVTPTNATWVDCGGSTPSYTATPNSGWQVTQWYMNGVSVQTGGAAFVANGLMGPAAVLVLFDAPPVWSNQGNVSIRLGQAISLNVSATDADGTTPTLSALAKPLAATFTDLGNGTGTFSWTPTQTNDLGQTTIRLEASDGQLTETNSFVVWVSSLAVTNPVAGAKVRAGSPLSVAWTGGWPLGAVDVGLWKGTNFVRMLTNNLGSPTSNMVWDATLYQPIRSGTDYWVTVIDADNPADSAGSAYFSIINGGLSWLHLLLRQ